MGCGELRVQLNFGVTTMKLTPIQIFHLEDTEQPSTARRAS